MLAKRYRLPVQDMYKKTGQTFKGRYFLIKIFASEEPYSRVGVVISRKVSPKATVRNRLKRIVFNFFRENFNQLPQRDYLIILLPAASKIDKQELLYDISKNLKPKT